MNIDYSKINEVIEQCTTLKKTEDARHKKVMAEIIDNYNAAVAVFADAYITDHTGKTIEPEQIVNIKVSDSESKVTKINSLKLTKEKKILVYYHAQDLDSESQEFAENVSIIEYINANDFWILM